MSQVIRKYASGGATEKPKLFSVSGLGDFDQKTLIEQGYRNIDEYIASKGLKGDMASNFKNAVQHMLEGIGNGTFSMDAMGNYKDKTGQASSTGEIDRKKFLGIKTGIKNTDNNAYGIAADYIHKLILDSPKYSESETTKPHSWEFKTALSNTALGGNWSEEGWNKLDYDPETKKWSTSNRLKYINQVLADRLKYLEENPEFDYNKDVFTSREDYINRFREAAGKLQDGRYDSGDYNAFARLGITDIDNYLKTDFSNPAQTSTQVVQGRSGNTDTSWNNPKYDRTVDEKGQYHIYKKGANEEVRGIIPGNVFNGVGNTYAYDGNIYDDTNLPEQYKQDITRARQAQLSEYTPLIDTNPFTKMLKGQGYNYITNLSQFASGIGDNILYGVYANPSDTNSKMTFYLKNPTTGKATNGRIEYNNALGEYQFISNDGKVINLGAYNNAGARSKEGTGFVDYSDTSEGNYNNLFNAWLRNPDIHNPATEAYKMVQSTLSKWISSGKSPFVSYNGEYRWDRGNGGGYVNVRRDNNGQWQLEFNKNSENQDSSDGESSELQQLLSIPISQRTREINDRILKLQGYRKDGGVIKAQLGTKFIKGEATSTIPDFKLSEEQAKKADKATKSFTGRSNASLGGDKEITDAGGVIKTSDKVRLGAAMADLASVGLGFIPGANFASTGIGVLSSATEFGADWASDGLDLGDIGRFGMNLGMDALSLIPAGKTIKATRALGKIKKSIPLIMTAINAANYLDPEIRSEYSKTIAKLSKGDIKSLNTGDFKNLSAIASTVLMGKNIAQSRKGWWNSSTTPSGKRRVTATIDGKQQTLEVDDALFENTKGKNQVKELKTKFAEQYNKANNLEGDKAIKPENVSVDTKYFGRRPQSEKVEGAQKEGNWFSNSLLGRHLLRYKDPSIVRGNPNIPLSDAWFLKDRKTIIPTSKTSSKSVETPSTVLVPTGKRNEFKEYNDEVQGYERTWREKEAERINQNRSKIDDSRDWRAGTIHREGSITNFEGVNANQIRAARRLSNLVGEVADRMAKPAIDKSKLPVLARGPVMQIPSIQTIIGGPAKVSYKGVLEGLERVGKQRLAKDIADTRIERSVAQNTETVARKQAEETKKNVERQTALIAAQERPKKALTGAARKAKQNTLNQVFNSKYYEVMDALRNKPNPTKQKNKKKKKTSKDNNVKRREFGGLIFKDGGLIPKYLGGNVMQRGTRGTWLNNDNTFKDATNLGTWDTYYNINGIIDDITKSGVLSNSNADNWVSTANRLSSMDLPWKKQLNAKGYNDWNALYSSTGLNKYFGEDKDKFDYLGPSTWNRRLLLQTLGYKYNSPDNPLTVGTDKVWYDNGVWKKLPSIPKSTTPAQVTSQQSEVAPILEEVFSTGKPASAPDKTTRNVKTLPEDVLALGRMVSGLVTNNRAAKIYKEGLKPTLLDTFENYVPLQGNFQAKTSAERQASNMESVAARPRTSDASLQLAGELEASDKANQARFQGDLQDAEMYYKTRMLGQQESDAAKARRVEVANKDRASMNAIDAAKKQIDAGRVTANYQQVLAPWLAGIENQFRQNRATERQLALESYMSKSNLAYINELNALAEKYKDNSAEFNRQKLLLDNKYSQQILDEKKRLIGSPWLIQFGEKGTKLTYRERAMLQRAKDFNKRLSDDNKQFHRDIMESKREHNKLIMNMSALTAALIKKGMQL